MFLRVGEMLLGSSTGIGLELPGNVCVGNRALKKRKKCCLAGCLAFSTRNPLTFFTFLAL